MAKPLKIGLVGAGAVSAGHLPAFQRFRKQVRLAAVCDLREEAARRFARAGKTRDVYTDFETMLREADIDAVDICTPHDQHFAQVIAAAAAGKHILVEKPLGIGMEECREMVAAAEKAGVVLMVAQYLRYLPQSQVIREMIARGDFGEIWALRSDNHGGSFPPRSRVSPGAAGRKTFWHLDRDRSGGGALISHSTHHVDLFRFYVGEIRRVTATAWTDHPLFINGAEESIAATLEFECGAHAQLLASWTTRTPWKHHYQVLGELGSFGSRILRDAPDFEQLTAPLEYSLFEVHEKQGGEPAFVPLDTRSTGLPTDMPFTNEILHFADCCREGREPLSSGRDNLNTMNAIFGIYDSAKTGKPVELQSP